MVTQQRVTALPATGLEPHPSSRERLVWRSPDGTAYTMSGTAASLLREWELRAAAAFERRHGTVVDRSERLWRCYAAEPVTVKDSAFTSAMVDALRASGFPEYYVFAYAKTGLLLTEANSSHSIYCQVDPYMLDWWDTEADLFEWVDSLGLESVYSYYEEMLASAIRMLADDQYEALLERVEVSDATDMRILDLLLTTFCRVMHTHETEAPRVKFCQDAVRKLPDTHPGTRPGVVQRWVRGTDLSEIPHESVVLPLAYLDAVLDNVAFLDFNYEARISHVEATLAYDLEGLEF